MNSSVADGAKTLYKRFSSGMGLGGTQSQVETGATTPNGRKSGGPEVRDKEGFVRKRRRLISLSRYALPRQRTRLCTCMRRPRHAYER